MSGAVHPVPTGGGHLPLPFLAKVRRDVKLAWLGFELVVAVYAAWREMRWRAVRAVAWWHWTWPKPTAAANATNQPTRGRGRR